MLRAQCEGPVRLRRISDELSCRTFRRARAPLNAARRLFFFLFLDGRGAQQRGELARGGIA